MDRFLEEITKRIIDRYKDNFDISVIFPSRRAGLYFKRYFSKYITSPCWSPEVLSLTDFISKYSGLEIKDNLPIIFELYEIYSTYFPEESFEDFIYWGEIIINDFDIIDKYLVDDTQIFKAIKDWKEIEVKFPTEIPEEYSIFWQTLLETKTPEKESFLKTWEALGKIYKEFTSLLISKKIAYEGLAFRQLFNLLSSGKDINKEKIIFTGFYAFSKAEEEIISYLIEKNKAELFFDIDNFYFDNQNQEAGYYLRKSIEKFKAVAKKKKLKTEDYIFIIDSNNLLSKDKKISIIGAPLQTGMVKALGAKLLEIVKSSNNSKENLNDTVVILPDESILLQVLYSIPDEIGEFNVTLGFPFKNTPLFSLLLLIQDLHKNSIKIDGKTLFHYTDIERILLHPYVRFIDIRAIWKIINTLNQNNIIYSSVVGSEELKNIFDENINDNAIEIIQKIFSNINNNLNSVLEYINNLILAISKKIENSNDEYYKKFQFEYIFYFYNEFEKLRQLISKHKPEFNINVLFKILINICKKMYIPFSGEPIKGLQVMGLLESRNLDFENVFILSLNEGILPSLDYKNSFIPYKLRKVFGLPTYEDSSKIEAYFFYRLIQRAKNIYLLYDTEISNYSKEKSRFILQIEKDIFKSHTGLNKKTFTLSIPSQKIFPITIEKTEDVQNILMNISHLSPTSLITYIDCKLKFYFERVIHLEKLDIPTEELDEATIGSIFHKIMELIYRPYIGKTVTYEIIENFISKNIFEEKFNTLFENAINTIINERKRNISLEYSEKNKLIKNVIKEFVKKSLEADKGKVPIDIIDLEKKIEFPLEIKITETRNKNINIKGFIDRIDKIGGKIRIVDYKTGNKNFLTLKPEKGGDFFTKIFNDSKYKDSFQIFLYLYIISRQENSTELKAELLYPKDNNKIYESLKENHITSEEYDDFYNNLINLINEIFNSTIPFTQTTNEEKCHYCLYKNICYK